jgi:riboflavin kinase/FMN adenylyltransferase
MQVLYTISGRVFEGDHRGRELGFPTANIRLHKHIPQGIYASSVSINGKVYNAATFVGSAKTFMKMQVIVESFIFDFTGDLYGKWLSVKLFEKIRENEKFASVEELIAQMNRDVKNIKSFFAKEQG